MVLNRIVLAALAVMIVSCASADDRSTVRFSTSATSSVLLLDEFTVAHTSGLTQRFFPAKRHPSNPVMVKTEAWEGVGPYTWGNRLMQDETTGLFRLWYIAYDFAGNFYRWGYAT